MLRAERDLNVIHEGLTSGSNTRRDLAAASQNLATPIIQILTMNQDVSAQQVDVATHVDSGICLGS